MHWNGKWKGVCTLRRAVWMFGEPCSGESQYICYLTITKIPSEIQLLLIELCKLHLPIYCTVRLLKRNLQFWLLRCHISGRFYACISITKNLCGDDTKVVEIIAAKLPPFYEDLVLDISQSLGCLYDQYLSCAILLSFKRLMRSELTQSKCEPLTLILLLGACKIITLVTSQQKKSHAFLTGKWLKSVPINID